MKTNVNKIKNHLTKYMGFCEENQNQISYEFPNGIVFVQFRENVSEVCLWWRLTYSDNITSEWREYVTLDRNANYLKNANIIVQKVLIGFNKIH